jgi:predicted nucleic acid-binding protein
VIKLYLFDASSIINLVKRGITRVFADGATLDLAFYESLNTVWKEHFLLKKISIETAIKLAEIITTIFNNIKLYTIKDLNTEILKLALKESLTIYDTSYLYTALKNNLILVSDDNKLREKSSKYIKTIPSTYFLKQSSH